MSNYPDDGQLVLEVGNQRVSGWETIRVTRGIERMPSDFDIACTEKYPNIPTGVDLSPGQVCRVRIGGDLVLTGYVDVYAPAIGAEEHGVRIAGRGACEDLVDCMAWLTPQVLNTLTVENIVTKIAEAYGVSVSFLADQNPVIPQIVVTLGDRCWDVIETVTRFGAMLAYEDTGGNLVLANVGTQSMASGVVEGLNVLSAAPVYSLAQRFTEYHGYRLSTDATADFGTGMSANQIDVEIDPGMTKFVRPDGKPRVRRMAIIGEQADATTPSLNTARVKWELARRMGRSQMLRVEVDSWRDTAGKLWEPNYLLPVRLPSCKAPQLRWVIGEVTYIRDDRGTRAELVIMPPEAFQPEPVILNPFDFQVRQDLDGGASGGTGNVSTDAEKRGAGIPVIPPTPANQQSSGSGQA